MLSPAPLESLQQPPNSLASKTPLTHTEVFPLNYSCRSAKLDENLQRREAAPCKPSSPTAVAVLAPAESPARARRDSLWPTPDLLLSARGAWSQSGSLISESAGTPSRVEGARPSSSGSLGYGRGDKTAPPVPTIVSACRRAWKHSRSESSVVGFESQFLGKKHTTEERTQEKPTQQHRSLCQRNAFNFFSPFDKNLPIKCQRFPPSHPPKKYKVWISETSPS